MAQQDIDVAQGKDLEAGAGVSAAKDALAAAEQGVAGSKAAMDKDKAMFAYARITAPFDGVVTQVYAYTGALLPADFFWKRYAGALPTFTKQFAAAGDSIARTRGVRRAHRRKRRGAINRSGENFFRNDRAILRIRFDPQTRTMHAEVHVPNPKGKLVAGMYASVLIPLHTAKNVLTLPIQVVQSAKENHGTVLVVNSKNRIEQRTVTLGLQTAAQVEIASGLQENDMVVFGKQAQYQTGELVSPKLVECGGKD